jgi:hypothetical protein
VVSPSTGIVLNNEMDDFSSPGVPNTYGLAPSEVGPHRCRSPPHRMAQPRSAAAARGPRDVRTAASLVSPPHSTQETRTHNALNEVVAIFTTPYCEANYIAPRRRPLSSMSPTIVLDGTGTLFAVAGASGRALHTYCCQLHHTCLGCALDVLCGITQVVLGTKGLNYALK